MEDRNKIIEDLILPNVGKPARYIGNELNSTHKDHRGRVKVAFSYPDAYEIGMSNLGLSILYHIVNKREDSVAERVYCPWPDMEDQMKKTNVPLFSLESWTDVKDFDILGFSVQNELTYTNLLNMLELARIPVFSKDRDERHPLVIAGGASTNNPLPLAPFIDAFVIGDGEEIINEIIDTYKNCTGRRRLPLLDQLSKIDGIFVPGHNELRSVKHRIVKDINSIDYPTKPIVPFIEIVHDRAVVEIMRGCPRRCKFCQAGCVNKPVRMLKPERAIEIAEETIKNTGFEEVSLVSLSSSDYPWLKQVAKELSKEFSPKRISLSLPSLRADTFDGQMASELQNVRKAGVTLAPEAGTQRLRDHIGKDLTEEEILRSIDLAFAGGANNVKLYFMIGLPTETGEDMKGIVDLAYKIIKRGRAVNNRAKITVNVATFIPKKNTPFENEKMITLDETLDKQGYLKQNLKHRGIELRWHDAHASLIEGLLSMGRESTSSIVYNAYKLGCKFDNWAEYFDHTKWEKAIAEGQDKI